MNKEKEQLMDMEKDELVDLYLKQLDVNRWMFTTLGVAILTTEEKLILLDTSLIDKITGKFINFNVAEVEGRQNISALTMEIIANESTSTE